MTPEERAARIIPHDFAEWEYDHLVRAVGGAIREAIAAEREACSRLAAVMGMPRQEQSLTPSTAEQQSNARLAARIATAIKARDDGPSQ